VLIDIFSCLPINDLEKCKFITNRWNSVVRKGVSAGYLKQKASMQQELDRLSDQFLSSLTLEERNTPGISVELQLRLLGRWPIKNSVPISHFPPRK
jgi:hypothetical protein